MSCKRKECTNEVIAPNVYCSQSCAAIVNNRRFIKRHKQDRGTYKCLSCHKEQPKRSNTMNKYCNNRCQMDHRRAIRDKRIEQNQHMGTSVGHKRQLINYFKDKKKWNCSQCGITSDQAGMELHHIDGDRSHNRLSNVAVLCRNCHGRTNNYKRTNKRNYVAEEEVEFFF